MKLPHWIAFIGCATGAFAWGYVELIRYFLTR
jgi:hypothetical protein